MSLTTRSLSDSIKETHIPCPCGSSSDAYCIYEDGHGYCYSCARYDPPEGKQDMLSKDDITRQYVNFRGVSVSTMRKFKVESRISATGEHLDIQFPYGEGHKIRLIKSKEFYTTDGFKDATLFGREIFSPGSAKYITITEGELDALSAFQMLGSKYPVLSVKGASSAKKDCAKELDYLNTFERIYLCFDNDEPGRKAAEDVATLFDYNKVYFVNLDLNDPNDYLVQSKSKEFLSTWHAATRFVPSGIVSTLDELSDIWKEKTKEKVADWPFPTLQEFTYGFRLGERVLITALEGVGKTSIMHALEHHILKNTDFPVGIIHLEESRRELLEGLTSYELCAPLHLPAGDGFTLEERDTALRKVVKKDDRLFIYKHFGSDEADLLLDRIRFMVAVGGCKFIFLDHITIAVTGLMEDDERRALDYLSTKLATMAEDLDFCLVLVSHVNDNDKTRGSRNISKIADLHVHLSRNLESDDSAVRDRTKVMVKKNRKGARTGPAGLLKFDHDTWTVKEG